MPLSDPKPHSIGISSPRGRPFSLALYLFIVFALSWPLQTAFVIWGKTQLLSYMLSSLSMIMVTVGTFIAGRYVFKDGFAGAGWGLGRPVHYLAVIALAAVLWVVPTLAGLALGSYSWPAGLALSQVVLILILRFVATLAPGFGEEFGWRGYLLPRLALVHSPRKAVVIHSVIWWAWHLPAIVGMGLELGGEGASLIANLLAVLAITLVSGSMHAVIYAYIWARSKSLAVATVYHSAYDEIRDTMERTTGFAPLTEVWSNLIITAIGLVLLLRANWNELLPGRTAGER